MAKTTYWYEYWSKKKSKKMILKKKIFKLMNNAGFGKTMKNVAKHRYIKLLATKTRKNHLVSEPNYYTTKFFTENFFGNRN